MTDFGPGPALCRAALALALARTDPEAALEAAQPEAPGPGRARDEWADAWLRYARAEVLRWEGDVSTARTLVASALRTHLAYGSVVGALCAAELLADAAALSGDPVLAARLHGAADASRSGTGTLDPYVEPVRRRCEAALAAGLTAERRAQAYAEGASAGLRGLMS
ncbi:hypothetical protein V2W30_20670 [Streptomyces sp. Q6]|uniref:Uncharacterized protein n=1 Tax=Streptomyces citrinus TaxID=3118173 RepID=A0ACD5AE32_9ACTN